MRIRKPPPKPRKENPTPKAESGSKGGNKGGVSRSLYKPEFAVVAKAMCRIGATDADLAEAFGVSQQSIIMWRQKHPAFCEACEIGKDAADNMVEQALFRRAIGYEHPAEKIFQYEGKVIRAEYVERYPPDTGAACFWLKNRRRKLWKDRWDIELTDKTPTGELLRKARERRKRMEGKGDAS